MFTDLEYRVHKIDPKPGETVIVSIRSYLPDEAVREIKQRVEAVLLPGVRAIVMCGGDVRVER